MRKNWRSVVAVLVVTVPGTWGDNAPGTNVSPGFGVWKGANAPRLVP